ILADHSVSALNYQQDILKEEAPPDPGILYANTRRDAVSGKIRYDQPLDWHLPAVAEKAADIAHSMVSSRFEPLCEMTVEAILQPAREERFAWQDGAVDFLQRLRREESGPALIFNLAGTGA